MPFAGLQNYFLISWLSLVYSVAVLKCLLNSLPEDKFHVFMFVKK